MLLLFMAAAMQAHSAKPAGQFINMGNWTAYIHCIGKDAPTVVVEAGLGDFAIDWSLVQSQVAKKTRVCTYDRAGYGFSSAGPMPRTYDQINYDLHRLLRKAGERGPFVLAGHSFGGPLVRNFARMYPSEVAGIAFVEASTEEVQFMMQGKPVLVRSFASGRTPPSTSENAPKLEKQSLWGEASAKDLDRAYDVLPSQIRRWHAWAEEQPKLENAMNSERDWSSEYLQRMHDTPQAGSLGDRPVVVLTRSEGGYEDEPPPYNAQLERDRVEGQRMLNTLSTHSRQVIAKGGHNVNLENPKAAADAILEVVSAVRKKRSR